MGRRAAQLAEPIPFRPCAAAGAVRDVRHEAADAAGVVCSNVGCVRGGFGGGRAAWSGDDIANDSSTGPHLSAASTGVVLSAMTTGFLNMHDAASLCNSQLVLDCCAAGYLM